MPELPEVEMARRYLETTALHETIRAAEVNDERMHPGQSTGKIWRRPWSESSFALSCGIR